MSAKPAITNPVMRILGSGDPANTTAFYREILGFQVVEKDGALEAEYGPARIRFGADDYPPSEWEQPLPRGSASLFFETDDITAMHEAIRGRGGEPSAIEKVNWIKFQMFEIRDPDGHTLWFGQSYNQPDASPKSEMMQQALPELPFDDVHAAVRYYHDVLGFGINYQQDDLGVMFRDRITVLLIPRT